MHHCISKMEFITSNKGSRKLCYAGHAYTKKKQSKTTMTWECTQRSAKQCKGSLITDLAVCTSLIKIITYLYVYMYLLFGYGTVHSKISSSWDDSLQTENFTGTFPPGPFAPRKTFWDCSLQTVKKCLKYIVFIKR